MKTPKRYSRRRFLSDLSRGAVVASALLFGRAGFSQLVPPSAPKNLRIGTKALLVQRDFTYLGAFSLPDSSGGIGTAWGHALAHRYVGNQLRFFSTTSRVQGIPTSQVYEVLYPGCATSNYPTASIVRHWGNIYHGKRWNDCTSSADSGYVYGLFWDEADKRLYWNYGDAYNASSGNNCCLGASTLNDNDGTSVAIAAWRMGASRGCKMAQGGMTSVPDWFATQYTNGRRLAVGFGGRASAESTGPSSDGPALAAIDPPNAPNQNDLPGYTALCGYPAAGDVYYCQRPGDYTDQIHVPARGPNGSIGGWQWMDFIFQTGVWIDTPTKQGFLFMPFLGHGNIYYQSSDIHSQRAKHWWFVLNPMDFAAVAQGNKLQSNVFPASWWEIQYPTYSYPLPPQDGEPYQTALGVTFDSTTNRLYVMFPNQSSWTPTVAVYQVS